jgi:hypothetical protein
MCNLALASDTSIAHSIEQIDNNALEITRRTNFQTTQQFNFCGLPGLLSFRTFELKPD